MRVSGRGWNAHAPAGQRPLTGAAAVPPGNTVRRNRARKRCQLGATSFARAGGSQSQGLWRLQRPRRGCGRSRWPAHQLDMSGHCSHELRCSSACQLNSGRRRRKICARGTGGLSDDGDSARGACAAAAALREHARDPGAPPHSDPPQLGQIRAPPQRPHKGWFSHVWVPSFLLLILASRRPPSRPKVCSLSPRPAPHPPRVAHTHDVAHSPHRDSPTSTSLFAWQRRWVLNGSVKR